MITSVDLALMLNLRILSKKSRCCDVSERPEINMHAILEGLLSVEDVKSSVQLYFNM